MRLEIYFYNKRYYEKVLKIYFSKDYLTMSGELS